MGASSEGDAALRERIRQQEIVADLGQQALEGDDLDQLMHDASVAVAETLGNDYCKVLELVPGGSEVFLRQGVGWRDGLVGSATVPTDLDSQAGYTLISEEPVIVDDLRTEDRFSGPELLTSHDVVSGISVIIGSVENPWGILGTHTTEHCEFSEDDATFVKNVANVLAAAIDRTEKEERLRERERHLERYKTMIEVINDGVYVVDEDSTFQMVNETYTEMLGYAPDDLVGSNAASLVEQDIIDEVNNLFKATDEGQVEKPSMEANLRTASGERLPVEASFAPLPESDDSDWERVGVVRDISDRKERERALRESERRYRTLVENFPNGAVGLFDEELEYIAVGGQLLDATGVDPEDRIGSSVYDIYPDEIVEEVEPYFHATLDGEANAFEAEYHDRHLYAHTLPVRNADNDVFAGMLVVQDVTERREYQRQLEESNERLEQFAYAASHDLQEPLRMVSSYLQLIESRYGDAFDEEGEEFLEFAVDGADRMRSMIDGLLQYSRVETQGDPFEPVELEIILEDVRENLQMKIAEQDAEITAESLPRIYGDEGQLHQVFQNLLANAIEYSGDDLPQIHVSAERNGMEWVVSVADEGIGIDQKDQERIFEVFQRLHGPGDHSGTGIGLALCERIVERHGGDIWVESEPGEGTTFSFTLPAVHGDANE